MRAGKADRIDKEATAEPKSDSEYAHCTHSAVFVEVKIDEQLGVIRVTRVVNAVAAGRILNPKAGSQILGAVVVTTEGERVVNVRLSAQGIDLYEQIALRKYEF